MLNERDYDFTNPIIGSDLDLLPRIVDNEYLLCPGVKIYKNKNSHRCTFITVNDRWSWEYDEILSDKMIFTKDNDLNIVNTQSVIRIKNGLIIGVVSSVANLEKHRMKKKKFYKIESGILIPIENRSFKLIEHR